MNLTSRHICGILLTVALLTVSTVYAQPPRVLTLQNGWKLISANEVKASGAAISQPGYATDNWYPIERMPATVLAILAKDGVYPHLFYGTNFLKVPPDLYKQDWWYRTSFRAPSGDHVFWIDFPGINYRAQIWLNGHLIAGDQQVVGMYVDHKFNVTPFIHRGEINVLAVKVTPERLFYDVSGVELGTTWVNWIDWHHFGYHGLLNPHMLRIPTDLATAYSTRRNLPPSTPVETHVSIAEATTTSVTLAATAASNGRLVKSGTITFFLAGNPVGRSSIAADGVATLTLTGGGGFRRVVGRVRIPSFVSDRNAGIWKPVRLFITGPVKVSNLLVDTRLPLPATAPARLTVYATLANGSSGSISGYLKGEITRPGTPNVSISQPVTLAAGETREISFTPNAFPQLTFQKPDLWWPYTLGKPALYGLRMTFTEGNLISDEKSIHFGIREVTQYRDHDEEFPQVGKGGSFYLKINGKNFLIRGAAYTPDLLFHYDPKREAVAIAYAKNLGLNMLRSEGHIASEHLVDLADQAGVPLMYGWVCCAQWESWKKWSPEDYRVALASERSQILMLRSHPSVFIWANGSDGLPPEPLRSEYRGILAKLHWQNAVVDTVSSFAKKPDGERVWDGIQMQGPYTFRPPSYWFAGRYVGAHGSSAEQGDNENIPPYESLKKFIPADKLWPPNQTWFLHAGSDRGANRMLNERRALRRRYGPSNSVQELAEKAQVQGYAETRAQFEDYAANGWATHKMTIYWMLTTVWPSFYAHLYDYYLKPGGFYFGAKKGLRPLSVVFDYYATGDRNRANITVVNQTATEQSGLRVRVRIYDLDGKLRFDQSAAGIHVASGGAVQVLSLPRPQDITSVFFIRCDLFNKLGERVVENTYWQSTTNDDIGGYGGRIPDDNPPLDPKKVKGWANFTALNTMPKVKLQMSGSMHSSEGSDEATITLHNPSRYVAFFERVEVTKGKGGDEVLPITYSDNDVTLFPGETLVVTGKYNQKLLGGQQAWLKLHGYNTNQEVSSLPQK